MPLMALDCLKIIRCPRGSLMATDDPGLPDPSGERVAQKAAAEAARKARNAVYGITYRQIEQYVIARYAECKNSRLMGSLAAAVRAGRMLREGKVYVPTGSMLSKMRDEELSKVMAVDCP